MLGTTFASALPFLNYLRPANSPFLIIVFVGILAITNSGELAIVGMSEYFFYIPIYVVLLSTTFMSFFYNPPDADELIDNKSEDYKEKLIETDNLFKFSRSIGLSASIVSLYLLFKYYGYGQGFIFILTYSFIITNLIVFSIYLFFRTIQEESPNNTAIFQIAFLTAGFLVGGVSLANKTNVWDEHFWTSCTATVALDREKSNEIFLQSKNSNQGYYMLKKYDSLDDYLKGLQILEKPDYENSDCTTVNSEDINESGLIYKIDIKTHVLDWQFISYIVLFLCWLSYILFWIIRLKDILRVKIHIAG